jgi:hypothetical protein
MCVGMSFLATGCRLRDTSSTQLQCNHRLSGPSAESVLHVLGEICYEAKLGDTAAVIIQNIVLS